MCQGTFFFTHVSRSYASSEKKSGRYGKCFSMIGEKGGMVPQRMVAGKNNILIKILSAAYNFYVAFLFEEP